jgi:transposase-like protein
MRKPKTLLEFQNQFRTEEDCLDVLEKLRWPKGFICPNCQHDEGYRLTYRRLYQCAVCRKQTSVTAGTIFHKTRIPLLHWFWIIFLMCQDKGGASASRITSLLGMHYKTAWHLLQKIRHAMARRDEMITLAGYIELDEAVIGPHARKTGRQRTHQTEVNREPRKKFLGRKPRNGRRRKSQIEVLVMVERENAHAGNVVMRTIYRTTRDDIREVVEDRVEPKQWFKTDGCQAHDVLRSMGHKLEWDAMSGPKGSEELPVVHRAISLLKRSLMGTYHGVSRPYLQRYLDEFAFRFNRRDNESNLWKSALTAAALALPMTYAELKL